MSHVGTKEKTLSPKEKRNVRITSKTAKTLLLFFISSTFSSCFDILRSDFGILVAAFGFSVTDFSILATDFGILVADFENFSSGSDIKE